MNKRIFLGFFIFALLACFAFAFSASIIIHSPSASVSSGESIPLNFTTNETVAANYSLDGSADVMLGTGTQFSSLLNGSLPYGVIANGQHNITLKLRDLSGDVSEYSHLVNVNDNTAPFLSINLTNNSLYSGPAYSLALSVSSNEYGIESHSSNNLAPQSSDLGISKTRVLNVPVIEGSNQVVINLSDFHNNSASYAYNFGFSLIQAPTCSDALQNQGESGIDCGGPCSPCVLFTVATNRQAYNITDSVQMTIVARSNSTVNITVRKNNQISWKHFITPAFPGFPIYEQRNIGNTSNSGNYTIEAVLNYLNTTETKFADFEVVGLSQSPIVLAITANATTVNEGSPVLFGSTIQNNLSAVSYKWDFQNDGIIDSTEAQPAYVFNFNGTSVVNLTVTDGIWNQTDLETITVRKLFNITIFVRDNATASLIQNAEIEYEGFRVNTSTDGRIDLQRPENTGYNLIVRKPGYETFSNKTAIKGNAIFEVNLIELDITPPLIEVVYPADQSVVQNNTVVVRYIVSDKSTSACSIFEGSNSTPWTKYGTDVFVQPGVESTFIIPNLLNGTHQIQLDCVDRKGNKNVTFPYTFRIDPEIIGNELSVDLVEQDRINSELISEIDEVLQLINSYGTDEKAAAESMQLAKMLERAKIEIQRASRDLQSLKWRRLNGTELEIETQNILNKVENLRHEVPRSIKVVDKSEFVSYPTKDDISKALELQINDTNYKFSKKELKQLVDRVHKLQSAITVTTKVKIVDIEYISGATGTVTIVHKTVTNNKDHSNMMFYEIIPKEIASNVSEITFLFDYEVVESDPVIKVDTDKVNDFSYYFSKEVALKKAENIKSILLESELKKEKASGITGIVTGFVPSDGLMGSLIDTSNIRLIIEVVVIIALLLVFIYYQAGGMERIGLIFNRQLANQLKEFDYLHVRAENYLDQNKYDEAKVVYKELSALFTAIPKEARAKLHPKVLNVHYRVDFVYMSNSLNEAFNSLNSKDVKNALRLYSKISALYKSLPKDFKSNIHARCLDLYKKING